jgi:hypothetical protein
MKARSFLFLDWYIKQTDNFIFNLLHFLTPRIWHMSYIWHIIIWNYHVLQTWVLNRLFQTIAFSKYFFVSGSVNILVVGLKCSQLTWRLCWSMLQTCTNKSPHKHLIADTNRQRQPTTTRRQKPNINNKQGTQGSRAEEDKCRLCMTSVD